MIGENGLLLSGGERQRLAIARVILKNAPILILDEAHSKTWILQQNKRVMQSLERFMAGRTVLIISHRHPPEDSRFQIIHLENGRLA